MRERESRQCRCYVGVCVERESARARVWCVCCDVVRARERVVCVGCLCVCVCGVL